MTNSTYRFTAYVYALDFISNIMDTSFWIKLTLGTSKLQNHLKPCAVTWCEPPQKCNYPSHWGSPLPLLLLPPFISLSGWKWIKWRVKPHQMCLIVEKLQIIAWTPCTSIIAGLLHRVHHRLYIDSRQKSELSSKRRTTWASKPNVEQRKGTNQYTPIACKHGTYTLRQYPIYSVGE